MNGMFFNSKFNRDISKWNVSKVSSMSSMFEKSKFNGDISEWDVSNVKNMSAIFLESNFKKDLNNWKPYSLEEYEDMFHECHMSIPYWSTIKDQETRNKAIDAYHLHKELNNQLSQNNNSSKKIKI
jgi:surface protein